MTAFDHRSALGGPIDQMVVRRIRDVLYWIDGNNAYVLACDSNAGIGQQSNDSLKKSPDEVGYSSAKVPLMEVLATGATPLVLTNAMGGPRDDYGRQLLAGIDAAIREVDAQITLTGSDETNVSTQQTAVGVTVVGRAPLTELRLGCAKPGDTIFVVGLPKDGLLVPYTEGDSDIANLHDLQACARLSCVHELLPVGSRGVGHEARELAIGAGTTVRFRDNIAVDLDASAGSSTCFLVALPPGHAAELAAVVRPPVHEIADLA